jgi:membrane protein implicated in regulation of membrane protease activity
MKRRSTDHTKDARKRIWKPSVLARYWLLQLPGILILVLIVLLLRGLFPIPLWMVVGIVAVWVAKDALLYLWLWRSYDPGFPSAHSMIGARGVAAERIDPTGYARVRGELWRVELVSGTPPIEKGEQVLVQTTRDLTLLVGRPEPP